MLRRGGETDLVVNHDVNGAAGAVAGQVGQVQGLGHHTLSGERGVTVQHQRHHGEAAAVGAHVEKILLGAHQAFQYRVHRLEVRGVGGQ